MDEFKCPSCYGIFKQLEGNFNKNRSNRSGFASNCKICTKKSVRKWNSKNPVKYQEITAKNNKVREQKRINGEYRESRKIYRENNKEDINRKMREYRYFKKLGRVAANLENNLRCKIDFIIYE